MAMSKSGAESAMAETFPVFENDRSKVAAKVMKARSNDANPQPQVSVTSQKTTDCQTLPFFEDDRSKIAAKRVPSTSKRVILEP